MSSIYPVTNQNPMSSHTWQYFWKIVKWKFEIQEHVILVRIWHPNVWCHSSFKSSKYEISQILWVWLTGTPRVGIGQQYLCLTLIGMFISYLWFPGARGSIVWLRHHATSRKVADSNPNEINGFFSAELSFQLHCGCGVDSASHRNEYQESSWG
jgi:hypothetical protein